MQIRGVFKPNAQNIKTTASIPTKFCIMIKTTKYSVWEIQIGYASNESNIAEVRHVEKSINFHISATI